MVCSLTPLVVVSCVACRVPALPQQSKRQHTKHTWLPLMHTLRTAGKRALPSPNEWNGTSEGSIAAAPAAADAKAPRPLGGPRGERGGGRRGRRVDRRLAARAAVGSRAAALAGKASFNDVWGPRRDGTLDYTAVLIARFRFYYLLCITHFWTELSYSPDFCQRLSIHVNHVSRYFWRLCEGNDRDCAISRREIGQENWQFNLALGHICNHA